MIEAVNEAPAGKSSEYEAQREVFAGNVGTQNLRDDETIRGTERRTSDAIMQPYDARL